jgi:hypothetical protein
MLPLRYLTFIQYQATYGLSNAELDMISRALLLALVPSMSEKYNWLSHRSRSSYSIC